jgi:hypothetical protein
MYSQDEIDHFVKLVADLRAKQKAYFADRNQNTLATAKAAEKQVDGWLKHFADWSCQLSKGWAAGKEQT